MADAHAIAAAPPHATPWMTRVEQIGVASIFGVAGALQLSIAAAQSLLGVAVLCWLIVVLAGRERVDVPRFFWPLALLAIWTLISAAFSPQPAASFADTKQLVLFLIIPLAFRFISGARGPGLITMIVSVGAATAAFGIFQYGILRYDHLGMRPRGTLGHYMTYSGLLMLVIGIALARVLFGRRDRLWAALVLPALAVAVALTFTRSAWVGVCVAAALLFSLKDLRLFAVVPVVAAIFFAAAPADLTARFVSMFNLNDPTNRDRVAMMREGRAMIAAHPIVGVGPNMVEARYAEFRDPGAVEAVNPHLHNVPLQIAAERGLPALGLWIWFVAVVLFDLVRGFRAGRHPVLGAAALAAMAAMLAAGMFEYNFGDSEFLMLLLLVLTLPFAAERTPSRV